MEKQTVTVDTANRLALCIMQKYNCNYKSAMDKLTQFRLTLVCGEEIRHSLPLQAALLTAVATGARTFLGGVFLQKPENVPLLLPWPGENTLSDVAEALGATIWEVPESGSITLVFGTVDRLEGESMQVVCNNWQGGVLARGEKAPFEDNETNLPLGGIAAGALGVGLSFLKTAGIAITACDDTVGISLWRPDLNWLDKEAEGPVVDALPEKYWLLGLGHLGQAFIWTIGLLPYHDPSQVHLWLQDDDKVTRANHSGGLLSSSGNIGVKKARVCAAFLEKRGFKTSVLERKFDKNTIRTDEEPSIALCGFDKAEGRRMLESAGFDLIIEVALGGNLKFFDNIILHTFPDARRKPKDIWKEEGAAESNEVVRRQFQHLAQNGCGVLAQQLSEVSVSSSFVGAFAAALAIAEVLRAYKPEEGYRYDTIVAHIRDLASCNAVPFERRYFLESALNGQQTIG